MRGSLSLQTELLQNLLPQTFPDFVAGMPWQGGLFVVQEGFRVFRSFFESRALIGQPPLELTLFHRPSVLLNMKVL